MSGWPDLAQGSGYVSGNVHPRQMAHLPALAATLTWAGPRVLLRTFLAPSAATMAEAAWLLVLLVAAALAAWGLVRATRPARSFAAIVALAWLATLATTCLLRDGIPWYMTHLSVLASAALGAALLAPAMRTRSGTIAVGGVVAGAIALGLAQQIGYARMVASAELSLPQSSLHDVLQGETAITSPMPTLAAWQTPASGRFLCSRSVPLVLHGDYAVYADASFGLDALLDCGRRDQVRLGGDDPALAAEHWAGMPARFWKALGRDPEVWVGGYGLARPVRVSGHARPLALATPDRYPPRPPHGWGERREHELTFRAPLGSPVLTVPILSWYGPVTIDAVIADGRTLEPLATGSYSAIYRCPTCVEPETEWRLRFRAQLPEDLDVVALPPPSAPSSRGAGLRGAGRDRARG
jgi:hypothetical protein